jgi:hypothetical protein
MALRDPKTEVLVELRTKLRIAQPRHQPAQRSTKRPASKAEKR